MPRVSPLQSNFNSGEFSPLLQGRVDAERYKSGLGTCFNAIPTLQGPVTRRSGSRFVAQVKNQLNDGGMVRLIPFKYSNTQTYIIEFGDQYIRFYTNRAQLLQGMSVYELTVGYLTFNRIRDLKFTQSLDVLYITHPDLSPLKLQRFGATDWAIQTIALVDGPYLNLGLPDYITQVTSAVHVPQINASAATGSITVTTKTGDYAALAITAMANNGSGEVRITLANINEFADRSQVYVNGATGTTGANGTWKAKRISTTQYDLIGSAFNAAYTGGGQIAPAPFVPNDTNARPIRIKFGGTAWGYGAITGYTNGATVTVQVINTLGSSGNTPLFRLGAWSESTGYPTCCVFHDDRLYFGGPRGFLQRIDGSVVSDYENFSPTDSDTAGTILPSSAVSFTLNSNDANAVTFMTSDEYGMPIGTKGGPFVMRASSLNEAITPTNISVKRVDSVGAADQMAVYAGKSTIYISSSLRKIFELTYYYNIDGFRKIDLTEIAEHLPDTGISSNLAFQSSPQPILWCAREDGSLLSMTFDRNVDTLRTGWSRHVLSGVSDSIGSQTTIESIAVIPSPDGSVDDVWMIANRYVNGVAVRHVEYLEKIFEGFDEQQNYLGSDAGVTYDSASTFLNPPIVSDVTNAFPANVEIFGHGLSTGNYIKLFDIKGLLKNTGEDVINNKEFQITVVDADNFTLDGFDATQLTAYIPGLLFEGGFARKGVTTISGLTWLEGEEIAVVNQGEVLPNVTVTAGVITLSERVYYVQMGLPYDMKIQQLRLEAGSADGTSLGKNRRIEQTAVMVNRSFDFEIGVDFDHMTPVDVSETDDFNEQTDPLFTGIIGRIQINSNYDFQNQLAFRVSTPTPFTLVAVMPQQTTYDKG